MPSTGFNDPDSENRSGFTKNRSSIACFADLQKDAMVVPTPMPQETERGDADEQRKTAMKRHSEGELDEKRTYHDHDPQHREERRDLGDHDLRRARRQHQQLFDGSAFAFTNHGRFGDERCIEEQSQPEYSGYQKPRALQAGVVKKGRLQ